MRVKYQMCFSRLIVRESSNDLTTKCGFPGADITDNHIQAPSQAEREFHFLKAAEVLTGLEKKLRIRRVGKRFLV